MRHTEIHSATNDVVTLLELTSLKDVFHIGSMYTFIET